jgi:hypothetical protein
MKYRFDVIQYLIDTFGYERYLELGCRQAHKQGVISVEHIQCKHKDSVDINSNGNNYVMTTDKFFETTPDTQKYDIIFIDADHEKNAVLRDIENALLRLNDGGTIICHDINPPTEQHLQPRFCNNCWETWAHLRSTRYDLEMYAVDVDMVGVIRKGSQTVWDKLVEATWEYLQKHKTDLLNLISVKQFKDKYKL